MGKPDSIDRAGSNGSISDRGIDINAEGQSEKVKKKSKKDDGTDLVRPETSKRRSSGTCHGCRSPCGVITIATDSYRVCGSDAFTPSSGSRRQRHQTFPNKGKKNLKTHEKNVLILALY